MKTEEYNGKTTSIKVIIRKAGGRNKAAMIGANRGGRSAAFGDIARVSARSINVTAINNQTPATAYRFVMTP